MRQGEGLSPCRPFRGLDFMYYRHFNPIRKRNMILSLGITIVLIAVFVNPSTKGLFTTALGQFQLASNFLLGLFIATTFSHIIRDTLKSRFEPWYISPCALDLWWFLVVCFLLLWLFFGHAFASWISFSTAEEVSLLGQIFGWALIWIVLLEWISYEK